MPVPPLAFVALPLVVGAADPTLTDLRQLDLSVLERAGWIARKEERRVILQCSACEGSPSADVQLSQPTDGTEGRIRSGATTAATMFAQCKANASRGSTTCHALTSSNLAGAVGFVSDVSIGERSHVATQTLWQDGYLLVIRVLSESRPTAQEVVRRMTQRIGAQIVHE